MFATVRPRLTVISLRLHRFALLCVLLLAATSNCHAQKRSAFVVGNENYQNISRSPNAIADATAVAKSLGAHGFGLVSPYLDLTRSAMSVALESFAKSTRPGDLVIFYFVGNGIGLKSQILLLPVDVPPARLGDESRTTSAALALDDIIRKLQGTGAKVICIIDAARDNPFDRPGVEPLDVNVGFDAISQPVAKSFVLFSAGPGEVSYPRLKPKDGSGLSIFASAVVSQLDAADAPVSGFAAKVRAAVQDQTRRYNLDQNPASYVADIAGTYLSGRSAASYPSILKVYAKPDGARRFKLWEIGPLEEQLPDQDECEPLGKRYSDQLERETGINVRFWVRIRTGDLGYCQRFQNQWVVEYFDRDIQDALILNLRN
jgi:hypothetical protein